MTGARNRIGGLLMSAVTTTSPKTKLTVSDEIEIHASLVKQFRYQSLPCRWIYTCIFLRVFVCLCMCRCTRACRESALSFHLVVPGTKLRPSSSMARLLSLVSPPLKNIFFKTNKKCLSIKTKRGGGVSVLWLL